MLSAGGDITARLHRLVVRFLEEHRLHGASTGVVVGDRLEWSRGYGFADRDAAREATANTLYRIASITKTFTGTALMQLRDVGRVRLEDPLVQHIPEFAAAHNPFGPIEQITLNRLLMHESGLMSDAPGARPELQYCPPTSEVLAEADRIRIAIPPDSASKYSNLAFQLLGEVVARAAGEDFTDVVQDQILEPLAMSSTTFDPRGELTERVARGYDARWFSDHLPPAAQLSPTGMEADGGLFSSVVDLARWISFQFRANDQESAGLPLRPSSLREMHRPRVVTNEQWTEAQGLAWYSTRRGDTILLGHDGGLDGFITSIRFNTSEKVGSIVLLNGIGPAPELAFDLATAVLEEERSPDGGARPRPKAIPPELGNLLGLYVLGSFGDEVRVEWRDDRLALGHNGDWHALERTDAPLTFVVRGGRASGEHAVFERGESGDVEALNLAGEPYVKMVEARRLPSDSTGTQDQS